jgi:hypothetical protein
VREPSEVPTVYMLVGPDRIVKSLSIPKLKTVNKEPRWKFSQVLLALENQTIVLNLIDIVLRYYRTVVADNFLASISLAERLLEHDTYLIGTLRSNRIGSGNEVLEKQLRRGTVYRLQNKDCKKLNKSKGKRDVLMISARPSHPATVGDAEQINIQNVRIMKPQLVLDYNKGRQDIDLSDQLSAYYTCLRQSIKWYYKMALELVLGRQ